ncbi:MAG: P-type conjugative transfer protein TrbG [Hyphomonadaceae bacterium]|nr:P-type conjugative transfer protein TrbG [Hyphomonadaceae bacterium]
MNRHIFLAASLAALNLACPAVAQPKPPTVTQANQAAIREASDASLVGALHEFAYERGALYAIQASPQRITDIALEPSEALLSVSAGDTTRWIVGDARSGTGTSGQAHVLVKPNAAGLATNLVIMTDRRVYHVELKSVSSTAMAAVSWRYPADLMLANNPAPTPPLPAPLPFFPEQLNLRYRIDGDKPDWRPLAAFDDGRQVFIEMPEAIKTLEAPPLFVIGDEGPELTNYRVAGKYYVVDRLFAKAELKLGTGWGQKKVQIYRQTPITGGARG